MDANRTIQANVALHLKIEDQFFPVLQIPKSVIPSYALKPYKWLRFLGYIIYGDLTPGIITYSEDGEAVSDDLMDSRNLHHDNIYYLPFGAPRLLDPAGFGTRSRSSQPSSSLGGSYSSQTFRSHSCLSTTVSNWVLARDGERCVLNGQERALHVCHLIPRAKGLNYFKHITRNRGDIRGAGDEITSMDDPRNQITLNACTHAELDNGYLAFLLTPNECLSRADIPQPALESRAFRGRRPDDDTFLTVHYYPNPLNSFSTDLAVPQNCDIWQPDQKIKWPPRTIFNYVYARAIFNHWAHPEKSRFVEKATPAYQEVANITPMERERNQGTEPVDNNFSLSESDVPDDPMGPVDILWPIAMGSKIERGDPTPIPSKDVALESRVEAWRHGVTTASD